jgi:hypothetical protein
MADNVLITAGAGTTISADDIGGGVLQQRAKATWGPDGTGNDTDDAAGKRFPVLASAPFATVATTVTRPSDTNQYTANDAWSDSTSAPTTGGFTFTSAARQSGGSGVITDVVIVSSANQATLMQGEIWIFDTAVTAINDNAAFTVSDTEYLTAVAIIPFTMVSIGNATSGAGGNVGVQVSGLNIGFTTVGSANLRFLIKVINAYTPVSAETLTVRLKIAQIT